MIKLMLTEINEANSQSNNLLKSNRILFIVVKAWVRDIFYELGSTSNKAEQSLRDMEL